jgi:hypothetical protein
VLQNHYCVPALQHRLSYNVTMSLSSNQQSNETEASAPGTMGSRRARARRIGLVSVALLGTGLLVAACGSSPSAHAVASLGKTTTTTGTPAAKGGTTTSPANSALAFVNCMRTHGVPNMPEPVVDGRHVHITVTPALDPNSPRFVAAYKACKHLLPNDGGPSADPITPADQADYLRAVACMRSHGFPNFPDPMFQGNTVTFGPTTPPIDTKSAKYGSALATCERLVPAGLPYSSPSA